MHVDLFLGTIEAENLMGKWSNVSIQIQGPVVIIQHTPHLRISVMTS